jgi:hypothetical protein
MKTDKQAFPGVVQIDNEHDLLMFDSIPGMSKRFFAATIILPSMIEKFATPGMHIEHCVNMAYAFADELIHKENKNG